MRLFSARTARSDNTRMGMSPLSFALTDHCIPAGPSNAIDTVWIAPPNLFREHGRPAGLPCVSFLVAPTPCAPLRAGRRIDHALACRLPGLGELLRKYVFSTIVRAAAISYSGRNLFTGGIGGEPPAARGLGRGGPRPTRSSVWGEAILLAPLPAYSAFDCHGCGPGVQRMRHAQSGHAGASYNRPPVFASTPLRRRWFPSSTGFRKAPPVLGGCLWGDQRGRRSPRFCG